MAMRQDYAGRARALVGTRFRPQGRSEQGLDCIGVIFQAFAFDAGVARQNYRLRGDHRPELEQGLIQHFRRVPLARLRPGDVIMMRVSDDQLHLGVRTHDGFVHAHAGVGLVVETPGMPEWAVVGVYRKRARPRGN